MKWWILLGALLLGLALLWNLPPRVASQEGIRNLNTGAKIERESSPQWVESLQKDPRKSGASIEKEVIHGEHWLVVVRTVTPTLEPITNANIEGTASDGLILPGLQIGVGIHHVRVPREEKKVLLTAWAEECETAVVSVDFSENPRSTVVEVTITLHPGDLVRGTVRNVSGEPVPEGIEVYALTFREFNALNNGAVESTRRRTKRLKAKVESDGYFEIAGLSIAKKYALLLDSKDFAVIPGRGAMWVSPGPEKLRIVGSDILGVSVQWVASNGEPVSSLLVEHLSLKCRFDQDLARIGQSYMWNPFGKGREGALGKANLELRFVYSQLPYKGRGGRTVRVEFKVPGYEKCSEALHIAKTMNGKAKTSLISLEPLLGSWSEIQLAYVGKVSDQMGSLIVENQEQGAVENVRLTALSEGNREVMVPLRTGSYKFSWLPSRCPESIPLNNGKELHVRANHANTLTFGDPEGYGFIECGFSHSGGEELHGGMVIFSDGDLRSGDRVTWQVPIVFSGEKLTIGPLLPSKYFLMPVLPNHVPERGRYYEVKADETIEDGFVF